MSKDVINAEKLGTPVGPYSYGVRFGGLQFLSGQIGRDPESGKLVTGGVAEETKQVFKNLKEVLAGAGKTLNDALAVRVFLTDMADFSAMNAVYAEHFTQPYPARTTVAVAALPMGASVEIDLIAR